MNGRRVIRVRELMAEEFGTIEGKATVSEALTRMKRRGTAVLIVEPRHADDEPGMLLVSDIAREVLAKDRSPRRVNVYEIMRKPVVCVPPDMDIRYCSRLFVQHRLTRAPVVEDGRIIGIISPNRLVLDGLYALLESEQ